MSTLPRACNSIAAIKSLAQKLKKSSENIGLKHFDYLNAAARHEGFENFNHARKHFLFAQPSGPWVHVRCRFQWRDTTFRDLAGHLQVDVTPRRGLSQQDLQRIVFVIPEFWTTADPGAEGREHFRIDSAYFHRVTSPPHALYSERLPNRNVMSFHLIRGRWQASIFDYDTKLSRNEMAADIERAIVDHITQAVSLHQDGTLYSSRILSLELHEQMMDIAGPAEQRNVLFAHNG